MPKTWKFAETLAMHIAAAIIVIGFLIYVTGSVRAHPACHQHVGQSHCHR